MARVTRSATLIALLVLAAATARAQAPQSDPAPALAPLRFLNGTWETLDDSEGTTGKATFEVQLGDRVMLRRSYAHTPASARGPASFHEDLMVISVDAAGGLRADYWDNDGLVIRYAVSTHAAGTAVFVSEIAAGQPRYRLSYSTVANGNVKGEFAVAPAGNPDAFRARLTWEARRAR